MRIIAGEFRSRRLLPPAGQVTRPITDRVKQSLFDQIGPLLPDSTVYDCFAGTGSMGLESLSRGASHAVFFESDRSALQRLRANIAALGVQKRSTVIGVDIFGIMETDRPEALGHADVVFLDPPYRFLRERPADLVALAGHLARRANPDGLIVFRHDAADSLAFSGLVCVDTRTYGGMTLEFLRKQDR